MDHVGRALFQAGITHWKCQDWSSKYNLSWALLCKKMAQAVCLHFWTCTYDAVCYSMKSIWSIETIIDNQKSLRGLIIWIIQKVFFFFKYIYFISGSRLQGKKAFQLFQARIAWNAHFLFGLVSLLKNPSFMGSQKTAYHNITINLR